MPETFNSSTNAADNSQSNEKSQAALTSIAAQPRFLSLHGGAAPSWPKAICFDPAFAERQRSEW
jgi:hypothetical protein